MSALPILYSFRRCPYAMRARMALIVAGIQCELREVLLSDKPQAMLEVSPKATVPVLLFPDGTVIDESLEIMLWSLSQLDSRAWLHPDAGNLDMMLALITRNDEKFKGHLDRYKYPNRYEDEQPDPLQHRASACAFLAELENLLQANDFLYGTAPSLADIAIFPFVRQFAAVEPDWFKSLDSPRLHAWLTGWLNATLFASAMHTYALWQDGNEPVYLIEITQRNTVARP